MQTQAVNIWSLLLILIKLIMASFKDYLNKLCFDCIWLVFFLIFVDFILKKVITFVWKKMRCRFDTFFQRCRTVFFNGCRTVLFPPQTTPIIFCRLETGWFHLLINPSRQPQTACCFFFLCSVFFLFFFLLNVTFKCTLSPILLMSISFIHTLHVASNLFGF
jgi:hypothetical protein